MAFPDAPDLLRGTSAVSSYAFTEDLSDEEDDLLMSPACSDTEISLPGRAATFRVMTREETARESEKRVRETADLVDIDSAAAHALLRLYRWDVNEATQAFFDDEARVRPRIGLGTAPPPRAGPPCTVCFAEEDSANFFSLSCNHAFCVDCWQNFVRSKVEDGNTALDATCLEFKCPRLVPSEVYFRFLGSEGKPRENYTRWLVNSFVQSSKNHKLCPSSSCELVLEYNGSAPLRTATCSCGFHSCWNCGLEAHEPASCDDVHKWNLRNQSEAENVEWILVNTKVCPKCKQPIEKNQGCSHMTCQKHAGGCGHEFCWICMQPWAGHTSCNVYRADSKDEQKKQASKAMLDRYAHYYERYMGHEKSRGFAENEAAPLKEKIDALDELHGLSTTETTFLLESLQQVVECRRVLKWTYVYGFYLRENDQSRSLFEFLQTHLEGKTDELHEQLEKKFDEIFPKLTDEVRLLREERKRKREQQLGEDVERTRFVWASPLGSQFEQYRSVSRNLTAVIKKYSTQICEDLASGSAGLKRLRSDDDDEESR
jgi:ariadne-1